MIVLKMIISFTQLHLMGLDEEAGHDTRSTVFALSVHTRHRRIDTCIATCVSGSLRLPQNLETGACRFCFVIHVILLTDHLLHVPLP